MRKYVRCTEVRKYFRTFVLRKYCITVLLSYFGSTTLYFVLSYESTKVLPEVRKYEGTFVPSKVLMFIRRAYNVSCSSPTVLYLRSYGSTFVLYDTSGSLILSRTFESTFVQCSPTCTCTTLYFRIISGSIILYHTSGQVQ